MLDDAARRRLDRPESPTSTQSSPTSVPDIVSPAWFALDATYRFLGVNRAGEAMLGLPRDQLLGVCMWDIFPAAREQDFGPGYERARRSARPVAFEAWAPTLARWLSVHVVPDDDLLDVFLLDITARRDAEEEAAIITRRLRLLGDVSELLSRSLDQGIAVSELARLVVPDLADWCTVTLVQTGRLRQTLGWAHRNPANEDALGRYARVQAAVMNEDAAIAVCLRTGEEVFVPQLPPLTEWVEDADSRALLEVLTPRSVLVVPLTAGGRTLGAMALVRTAPGVVRSARELETAREVARRAGLALDNARLYGEQAALAAALQRSLLTQPPHLPGAQVAVRYVTAAAEAQVGGDWYDAFRQRDGASVLVIGDVIGHDSQAAAAMGQVRGLLRGIAFATGDSPSDVLSDVDEAIAGLELQTSATAVVMRLETPRGLRAAGHSGSMLVSWSNAGHPPPLLVTSNGLVSALENTEADLLLGIDPTADRTERAVVLAPGSTVLLYTDGLVERRGTSLDEGLARLRVTLAAVHRQPLEQMCDALLARLLPPEAEDDVALLAVRVDDHQPMG